MPEVRDRSRTTHIIRRIYGPEVLNEKKRGFLGRLLDGKRSIQMAAPEMLGVWKRLSTKKLTWFIAIPVLVVLHITVIYYYNSFYKLRCDADTAEADVGTMLQKRHDLSVNLAKMLVDYADHERRILETVVNSRNSAGGADLSKSVNEVKAKLEKFLKDKEAVSRPVPKELMSGVFALAEQYPDLKLSQNFQKFIDALVETEKDIATARMKYNLAADNYAKKLSTVPGNWVNKLFRFEKKPLFKPSDGAWTFEPVAY